MDLITAAQAAEILGVTRMTVTRMVRRGDLIPTYRAGDSGALVFEREHVERLEPSRRRKRCSRCRAMVVRAGLDVDGLCLSCREQTGGLF